jgi:hypothetical protein
MLTGDERHNASSPPWPNKRELCAWWVVFLLSPLWLGAGDWPDDLIGTFLWLLTLCACIAVPAGRKFALNVVATLYTPRVRATTAAMSPTTMQISLHE